MRPKYDMAYMTSQCLSLVFPLSLLREPQYTEKVTYSFLLDGYYYTEKQHRTKKNSK